MSSAARVSWHRAGDMPGMRSPDIIHNHDFKSLYQPIFSPTHQRLVGYEALFRAWHQGKPVSLPALFRQAAAQGRIFDLDHHLLRLHLQNFSGTDLPVWLFLNITPQSCTRPDASLEQPARFCRSCHMAPERIVLELVEAAADNTEALLGFIHSARQRGFQIAIDDFGMGDSNFERLWRINPLIVKLDRSLLVNAEQHPRARMLLESLVRMIRESGSLVLLEGIENEDQARIALGSPFADACTPLLRLQGVCRCFVLDPDGIQQGRLIRIHPDAGRDHFNPLYESSGACWAHRDYFRKARLQPHSIHCSRPYVGLPDARRTVTVSTALNHGGRLQVLCVDIHPDDLLRGQMQFPDTL